MPHDAFISYSHAADAELANRLEAGLQRFAKPWYRVRQLRIFRDAANLNLTPHLWDGIVSALGSASHLLYLASPEAAQSKWVCKELDYWLTNKDRQKLLIVVTKGDVGWDDQGNDFNWTLTTCVPKQLSGAFVGEPFYLDLRWARTDADLSLQNPKFKEAIALLSATLHGKSVEDMIGEEVAQHRRMTRLRNGAIAALATLFLAASAAALVAMRQRAEAVAQRTEALRQRDRAVQQGVLSRVRNELQSGSLLAAVRTARAVNDRYGSVPLVQQTLREAAMHPTAVLSTMREPVDSRPQVTFSPDDTHILSLSENAYQSFAARIIDWSGRELRSFNQVYLARYDSDGTSLVIGWPWAAQGQGEADGSWCDNHIAAPPVTNYAVVGFQRLALNAPGPGVDLPVGFQESAANDHLRASICGNYVHLDRPDGTRVTNLRVPGVVSARFMADGSRLLVATNQRTGIYAVTPTGLSSEAPLVEFEGGSPVVAADGKLIATVSGTSSVLWDVSGREVTRRKGTDPVIGGDGVLLTSDGDVTYLWRTGVADAVQIAGNDPRLAPDTQWVMTTISDGRTRVSDLAGHELTTLDGVSGRFARRAPVALTATASGLVRLFDLRRVDVASAVAGARMWGIAERDLAPLAPPQQAPPQQAAGGTNACMVDCVSPDGQTRVSVGMMAVTPGAAASVALKIEKRSSGNADASWQTVTSNLKTNCKSPVAPLAFSPDRNGGFALACGNGFVSLYEPSGTLRWQTSHGAEIYQAVFTADGQFLLTSSADRTAHIWNAVSGAPVATFGGHESEVVHSAFSPQSDRVATVTSRGVLRVWARSNTAWGDTPLATVTLQDDAVVAATFASNATQIAARTRKGFLRRWIIDESQWLEEYDWVDAMSEVELRELGLP